MGRASDVFTDGDPDSKVLEVKSWLKSRAVRDFEQVSLLVDQLTKDTVAEIKKLADACSENKSATAIKKAMVKGIPSSAEPTLRSCGQSHDGPRFWRSPSFGERRHDRPECQVHGCRMGCSFYIWYYDGQSML